jgi:uncharacterized membrane protein
VGAIVNSSSLFFFSVCFVACGCKWAPSFNSLWRRSLSSFFFSFFYFFLLLLGAHGFHHQLLVEKEPKLPLFFFVFCFCFIAYGCKWVPSPSSSKEGVCSLFFILFLLILRCHYQVLVFLFFFVVFATPSPTLSRKTTCSLFSYLFFFWFLRCHYQDLA